MSRTKVAPWLLSASVFLTGATGLLTGAMTPAHAITSVEELRDVDSSAWAYSALSDLVEKYDVIEGYPDYTFKGNRTATRYEMAAALNALIKAVGRDLARLGAEKANKSDLATLARLQEEFRNELAALNARTTALEGRATAIEAKNAEQDTRLDLLEKTQIHGDLSFGILADVAANGQNANGDGIQDGIATVGRFRLGLKVPVVQGSDDSKVGEGDVIARIVGAFGRVSPLASSSANGNPISGYTALGGASSLFNEGTATDSLSLASSTTGINVRQNLFVESAYYKQHYKSGIPLLTTLGGWLMPDDDNHRTTADLYVGIVPWRNLFNRSPYKGDELNQFQNTALVNNQGLLVNNIVPTVALAWHQGLGEHYSADLTAAVSTMDSADALNGFSVTEELSFNYDTSFLGDKWTKPGNIYVGGYHIFFDGNQNLGPITGTGNFLNRNLAAVNFINGGKDGINAFYAGMNQEWWRGIGTTVDWVLNDTNVNNLVITALRNGTGVNANLNNTNGAASVGIQTALSTAITIPLTVFNQNLTKRAKDVIGFGYSWIDPQETADAVVANAATKSEHVFEWFYRWAVNDSVTVVPSVQAIVNRMGVEANDTAWVFGLRTNYVF